MRFIYMLRAGGNYYKVGITSNVVKRIKSIQTSNQHLIEIVTTRPVSNAEVVERELHWWLEKYRTKGGSEWFELTPEQALELIIRIGSVEIEGDLSNYLAVRNLKALYGKLETKVEKLSAQLAKYEVPIEEAEEVEEVKRDPEEAMLVEAAELTRQHKKASASFLQRKMRVGYARAARLIDELEKTGVVGPAEGSRPRVINNYTRNHK